MALINQGDINSFMRRENGEKLFEFRIVMNIIKQVVSFIDLQYNLTDYSRYSWSSSCIGVC